ncbi:hypothetical protein DRP77_03015 [Candidatus Poribacteria bacterium]|nr:MAG: hypothetical protein DRP77_03015 [Candidatus Poribacteria bacterium]
MEETGIIERLAKLEGMVEVLIKQVSDLSNRLDTMEMRLESLENRVDNRLIAMENRLNLIETRMHALEDRMASFTKWLIAALMAVWATIMGTLIAGLLLR